MIFPSAIEPAFTKTPANVKNDYVQSSSSRTVAAPPSSPRPSIAKKRTAPTPKMEVKKRKTGKKTMASRPIPRSLEECSEPDKMLIKMRDEGSEWGPIRKEWKELTGESTATSTLPNRYARLKSNFTVVREEDNALLLSAKREVEESFEAQKWDLVARVVAEKGGDTYAGTKW
ncbi:hypothetical protein DOTSEDRAFT_124315 [Dothistroma septosporum NZE10]|uniref:Myb-like domain-containing protein n=1 Tax=Dothistroma septosporum (strain NZE10 / CBS 128990) TaxID=675120 RepID=N1PXI1_DOTSN|nr:hypothetical protein DOTSEDRAFT_124315 [Dothistroma septosporum NZE10]